MKMDSVLKYNIYDNKCSQKADRMKENVKEALNRSRKWVQSLSKEHAEYHIKF